MKKYDFQLGYSLIRYDIRDKFKLSNNEYAIAHALTFVGKVNNCFTTETDEEATKNHRTNYRPTISSLAKDLGLGKRTLNRALLKLRKKRLVENDCLEATIYFVKEEQSKENNKFLYSIVQHGHRQFLNLTFTEYLVCSTYSRLNENREWVTLDKKKIAKTISITARQIRRIIKKMENKKLMITQFRKINNISKFVDVKMTTLWQQSFEKIN